MFPYRLYSRKAFKLNRKYINIHQKLLDRCLNNDQDAQFELYKLYYAAMYNTSLRIVETPEDAEDIMQEAFLSAFAKLKDYHGEVSFGAWLKRIVINRSLDLLKTRKMQFKMLQENLEIEEEKREVESKNATIKEIKTAVSQLPTGYRIVLSLILFEGYDHEEVSQILGITNSSSRSQFLRAKEKLRKLINNNRKSQLATG